MHACNTQEKRYRPMQDHIRRAHPDYYIPKLPATEESFQLMVNTPPHRPAPPPPPTAPKRRGPCMFRCPKYVVHPLRREADASEQDIYGADISAPATPGNVEGSGPAAANAAVALAQLHNHQLGPDWDSDAVCDSLTRRDEGSP